MIDIILTLLFSSLVVVNVILLALFFFPERKYTGSNKYFNPPLSIIIPAHNEEKYIAATIRSVQIAEYDNKKEVIVVDDGSVDSTAKIVKEIARKNKNVRVFRIAHSGKSAALNYGIKKAHFNIVAYLDADSSIDGKSLIELIKPLRHKNVSISSGIVRAKNTRNPLTWFQDIDYIVSSGWRYACDKINGTYIAPGFAAFKKKDVIKVGGFSKDTLTEDLDTILVLRKAGYGAAMTPAVMFTSVPSGIKGLIRQRMRWGRGSIQTAKKHTDILFSRKSFGLYSFPMHLFWYPFALIYIPVAIYWMSSAYISASLPVLSFATVMFFIKWLTIYGIAELFYSLLNGSYSFNTLLFSVAISWLLSFVYLVSAMRKFSAFGWKTLSYIVIFPYYWIMFAIQGFALFYESVSHKRGNMWNKFEGSSV